MVERLCTSFSCAASCFSLAMLIEILIARTHLQIHSRQPTEVMRLMSLKTASDERSTGIFAGPIEVSNTTCQGLLAHMKL